MKIKIIKQNKRFLALIVALTVALSCLILFIPTTSRVEARGSGLFIHGVEVPEHQLYIEEYILRIPLHRIHENNSVRIWRSNTSSQNNVLGRNSVVDLMRDGKATHTLKIRITFNDVFDLGERGNFFVMTEAEITLPHHQAHNRMFGGVPWVADVTFHANTYIEVGLSNNIFADFTHHARRSLPQNTPISYFNSISIAVYNYNHQLPLINHSGRANGSIREEPIDNFNFNLQGTHIQTRLVTREVLNPYSPYFNVNFGNTGDNFSINVEYGTGIANRPPRMPDWLIALIVISILIGVILLVGLMKKYVV